MNNRLFRLRLTLFALIGALATLLLLQSLIHHYIPALPKEFLRAAALVWLFTFLFIGKQGDDWQNLEMD
jgi:hypothetical protein